jgi:hypothetical protein
MLGTRLLEAAFGGFAPPPLLAATASRIPLFDGKKQGKTTVQAFHRPNVTLQVIDSIWVRNEIPYAAE